MTAKRSRAAASLRHFMILKAKGNCFTSLLWRIDLQIGLQLG